MTYQYSSKRDPRFPWPNQRAWLLDMAKQGKIDPEKLALLVADFVDEQFIKDRLTPEMYASHYNESFIDGLFCPKCQNETAHIIWGSRSKFVFRCHTCHHKWGDEHNLTCVLYDPEHRRFHL